MKVCTKCKKEKPFSEFYKRTASKDGLHPSCKACIKEEHKSYYQRNREKIIERSSLYYQENIDKKREYDQGYRRKNHKKIRKYKREWGNTSRGKTLTKKSHERYLATPEGRKRHQARGAVNEAVRRGYMPRVSTQKCKDCGRQAGDYHHYLGYEREHWLDVIPLCRKCHIEHGKN